MSKRDITIIAVINMRVPKPATMVKPGEGRGYSVLLINDPNLQFDIGNSVRCGDVAVIHR